MSATSVELDCCLEQGVNVTCVFWSELDNTQGVSMYEVS